MNFPVVFSSVFLISGLIAVVFLLVFWNQINEGLWRFLLMMFFMSMLELAGGILYAPRWFFALLIPDFITKVAFAYIAFRDDFDFSIFPPEKL